MPLNLDRTYQRHLSQNSMVTFGYVVAGGANSWSTPVKLCWEELAAAAVSPTLPCPPVSCVTVPEELICAEDGREEEPAEGVSRESGRASFGPGGCLTVMDGKNWTLTPFMSVEAVGPGDVVLKRCASAAAPFADALVGLPRPLLPLTLLAKVVAETDLAPDTALPLLSGCDPRRSLPAWLPLPSDKRDERGWPARCSLISSGMVDFPLVAARAHSSHPPAL